MKYIDEFRDPGVAHDLLAAIKRTSTRPARLMEVCGTHTMALARFGLKRLFPPTVTLLSGPGCPVCVTPQGEIDRFLALGEKPGVILTTFGDMLRVPGSDRTLEEQRARGADVRMVYSPLDAVQIARENLDNTVVFFGVGFETTAPAVALAIQQAKTDGVGNFRVLSAHKLMMPALLALADDPEVAIDGLLCPGNVSAIIGSRAYQPLTTRFHMPCVITGFEPLDLLQGVLLLVRQLEEGRAQVEVPYSRIVSEEGNPAAMQAIAQVFEPADSEWRGLGVIPGSGLRVRKEYAAFDASDMAPPVAAAPPVTCECGSILRGIKTPLECRAFGHACTPEHPIGPCMVSSEGACAAEYRYGDGRDQRE